ncbi:MAG: hypothetical protein B6U95_05385 [Thermofilum sp. ex4484_82]|nr:MAG: hypothetical protein B6U95_05385 [Thermofilum sp. ex4484_82]OYT38037.1 MAG: hypothetical protein B6U96_05380 [Archaeoglobales archaeon ex4484_92]
MSSAKAVKKELSTIAWLIEALDGYRVGRTINPKMVMKKVNQVEHVFEPKVMHAKKVIRQTTDYIANLPARDPTARKWVSVYLFNKLLLRITITLFLFSFFFLSKGYEIGFTLLYIATAILYVVLIVRWYSLNKILFFYEKNYKLMEGASRRLKAYAQHLIEYMRKIIAKENFKTSRYKLHLFNTDYDHIKVLKKPGLLRDYYLCEIQL